LRRASWTDRRTKSPPQIHSDSRDWYTEKAAAAIKQRIADTAAGRFVKPVPFSRLIIELLLARASGEVVDQLTVNWSWVVVRRGIGELDPDTFRLIDHYDDLFDQVGTLPEPDV